MVAKQPSLEAANSVHHEGLQGGGPGKYIEGIPYSESAEVGRENALPAPLVQMRYTY